MSEESVSALADTVALEQYVLLGLGNLQLTESR